MASNTHNQVQSQPPINWSDISQTEVNVEKLKLLTHTIKALNREGYFTKSLSEQEVWTKMRCQNCGTKLKRYRPPVQLEFTNASGYYYEDEDNGMEGDAQGVTGMPAEQQYAIEVAKARAMAYTMQRVKHACSFHDGRLFKGQYECCGGRQNAKGCCSEIAHTPGDLTELKQEWLFHSSPKHVPALPLSLSQATLPVAPRGRGVGPTRGPRARGRGRDRGGCFQNNTQTPTSTQALSTLSKRQVVSLDCEMGTTTSLTSTLIRLTVIDFFTKEILIDSLVAPAPPHCILHYNTRYSGVTFSAMNNAICTGNVIHGVDAARKVLFEHIDSETIVVVHGGDHDFTTLRWIHPANKIIDTYILEGWDPEVKEKKLKKSLKEVVWRRCGGIEIQNAKLVNGRYAGHNSVEDALACREIVVV